MLFGCAVFVSPPATADVGAPRGATRGAAPAAEGDKTLLAKENIDSELAARIAALTTAALLANPGTTDLDKAVARYNTRVEKGKFGAKDLTLNYFGFPRGFDFSEEGARVALEQGQTVNGLDAALYGRQQRLDRIHQAVTSALFQIALGFGTDRATEAAERTKRGVDKLAQLSNSFEAAQTADMIAQWSGKKVANEVFEQPAWDVTQFDDMLKLSTQLAFVHDPAVLELRNKLNSYCEHTPTHRRTAKVVEGTVSGITMLGPGLGIPIAAQAFGAAWGQANGGSEEAKLLKELYMQKQLESRREALRAEATLSLMNYQTAIASRNVPLLICSEAMLAQLVGAVGVNQILPKPVLDHRTFVNQPIQSAALGDYK